MNCGLAYPAATFKYSSHPTAGRAAAYCADALQDSGWAGRRGTGTQGSPGRGGVESTLRGW